MNNGANIIYFGTESLILLPGSVHSTNEANLTEMSQSYAIIKSRRNDAISQLQVGSPHPKYPNLYLFSPPKCRTDESHCFFDCVYYGVIGETEGGREETYETLDRKSNIVEYVEFTGLVEVKKKYVQPVYIYSYTIPVESRDRSTERVIDLPQYVQVITPSNGEIPQLPLRLIFWPGIPFFWELYDLERLNFGKYDQIREYWRLTKTT